MSIYSLVKTLRSLFQTEIRSTLKITGFQEDEEIGKGMKLLKNLK